jgi:subtilisin family serine protease
MKVMVNLGKDKPNEALDFINKNSQELLANYGQSVLAEVTENNKEAIKNQGYRIRDIKEIPELEINGYKINTSNPTIDLSSNITDTAERFTQDEQNYFIIQLVGPMHTDWKEKINQAGGKIYEQVSDQNHYLIGINNSNLPKILEYKNFITSIVPYHSEFKLDPSLVTTKVESILSKDLLENPAISSSIIPSDINIKANDINPETKKLKLTSDEINKKNKGNLEIILFEPSYKERFLEVLKDLKIDIIDSNDVRFIVYVNDEPQFLQKIINLPYVKKIDPHTPNRIFNEVCEIITKLKTFRNLENLEGLNPISEGEDQIIAVADTGLDIGINNGNIHPDFKDRIIDIQPIARQQQQDARDLHGHGTHVAGSVLGNGRSSNGIIKGMAPKAKLVFQSIGPDGSDIATPTDLKVLYDLAYQKGAIIHTNSWGASCNIINGFVWCPKAGKYDQEATDTDEFMFQHREFLILFSAGNDGDQQSPSNRIVNPPGTAKNVLTVGASESLRTLPSRLSRQADNENHVIDFSSIGPVANQRIKPDLVAPGTWILSARSSACIINWSTGQSGTHENSVGYGLPGGPVGGAGSDILPIPSNFDPSFSNSYMYASGTSMATPVTAGLCGIVREYLMKKGVAKPSAALIKALLINGTSDIGLDRNIQGWGKINLENVLFSKNSIRFDDSIESVVGTGDINSYEILVKSVSKPLNITLVWRDPPGFKIQNRLHLRIFHEETNEQFISQNINNILNNVQKITIPQPKEGKYIIEIEGIEINRGIPERPTSLLQDYALVVSNVKEMRFI